MEDLNEKGEEISPDNLTARLLWPDAALGQPTIGTRKTIQAIDRKALLEHFTRYYTPPNTVIAVTGQVSRSSVLAAARQHFGDWHGPAEGAPRPCPYRPVAGGAEAVWVSDSDSQISLQFAFRTPGRDSRQGLHLRLLRRILSWGGTSRLMLQLRERLGLTYNVEANLALYAECGCLVIDLAVVPENAVQAFAEVLKVVEDLCAEPVPAEELERIVQGYLFDLDFSLDHTEDPAVRYGWGTLVGYRRTLAEDRRDLTTVTSAELLQTARDLFVPGALKVAVVGPWRKKEKKAMEKLLQGFRNPKVADLSRSGSSCTESS
jgi:predicted Zn-dependent peptidase